MMLGAMEENQARGDAKELGFVVTPARYKN